jgi:phosphoribosylformylglycinamidine synthase
MWFKISVHVHLKEGVRNNEGIAIEKALHDLGYEGVSNLDIGKYMEFDLKSENFDTASKEAEEMCKKLLANPVIESYNVNIRKFL